MRNSPVSQEATDASNADLAPDSSVQRVDAPEASNALESLVSTLVVLEHGRSDGILDVVANGVRTSIYLARGVPSFAEQIAPGHSLERLFVRDGLLTQEQYVRVVQRMTETLFESVHMRFGEVAVALGYLTVDQVRVTLSEESRRQLLRCLEADTVAWRFQGDEHPAGLACFPESVRRLVLEATRAMSSVRRAKLFTMAPTAIPRISGDVSELVGRFGLKPEELRFVLSIDGRKSMAQLRATRIAGVEADAVLSAFFITGHLRVEGVDSSLLELDDAFEPSTSIRAKPVLPASDAVSSPPAPISVGLILPKSSPTVEFSLPADEVQEARSLAARAFYEGKALLDAKEMGQARVKFQRALILYPQPVEYHLYARWAELHAVTTTVLEREDAVHELHMLAKRARSSGVETEFATFILTRVR